MVFLEKIMGKMATKINSQRLTRISCELYKQKLSAWHEVTDFSKDKQYDVIVLFLLKDEKNEIHENVFSHIGLEDLKDGLNILIDFVISQLIKDELSDSMEKFEEFEDFQRTFRHFITYYIATFDSRFRKRKI